MRLTRTRVHGFGKIVGPNGTLKPSGPSDAERFTLLAPGVASATRFATDSLPGYHVEVRDLLLGPIETAPDVPLDGFALMELSTGEIEISIDERKERREAGDLWFVRRGARIAIRNLGEIATIHTTVLRPNK